MSHSDPTPTADESAAAEWAATRRRWAVRSAVHMALTAALAAAVVAFDQLPIWWGYGFVACVAVSEFVDLGNLRRRWVRAHADIRCANCGYDLRATKRCPECGWQRMPPVRD